MLFQLKLPKIPKFSSHFHLLKMFQKPINQIIRKEVYYLLLHIQIENFYRNALHKFPIFIKNEIMAALFPNYFKYNIFENI
jgi:hypothetical protein